MEPFPCLASCKQSMVLSIYKLFNKIEVQRKALVVIFFKAKGVDAYEEKPTLLLKVNYLRGGVKDDV